MRASTPLGPSRCSRPRPYWRTRTPLVHYERDKQLLPWRSGPTSQRRCRDPPSPRRLPVASRRHGSGPRAASTNAPRAPQRSGVSRSTGSGRPRTRDREALVQQPASGRLIGSACRPLFGWQRLSLPEDLTDAHGWHSTAGASPVGPSAGRTALLRAQVLARLAAELYTTDRGRAADSPRKIGSHPEMARRLDDQESTPVALHGRHWATSSRQVDVRLANAGGNASLRATMDRRYDETALIARHARLHCCLEPRDIEGMDAELAARSISQNASASPSISVGHRVLRSTRTIVDGVSTRPND